MHQGKNLKKLITSKSSVSKFAKKVGLTRSYLQSVFNNEELSMILLKKVAPHLGVEVMDLMVDKLQANEPQAEYNKTEYKPQTKTEKEMIKHLKEELRLKDKINEQNEKLIAVYEKMLNINTEKTKRKAQ